MSADGLTVMSSSAAARYFIKEGYVENGPPQYWDDDVDLGGVTWQPDVYRDAALIAERLGCTRLIDVGCGNAGKLSRLYPRFDVVGIDYGSNLAVCRARYPFGTWLEHDLESDEPIPLTAQQLVDALVICADVVEHLIEPERLLRKLRLLLDHVDAVLLSTPERDRARGREHMGPPPKAHHVREWAIDEFAAFLENEGFEHGEVGLTRSNDMEPDKNTILAKLFPTEESSQIGLDQPPAKAA